VSYYIKKQFVVMLFFKKVANEKEALKRVIISFYTKFG
jgi:hypothetical protein